MIKQLMPFDLQFFAETEGEDEAQQPVDISEDDNQQPSEPQEKTITMTQAEFDKAIQKRLDRDRQKQEEERRLEKMSAQEKYDNLKRQMDERDALERTRTRLSDEGLSSSFAKFLSSVDEGKTDENVKTFVDEFNSAVEARVEKLMKDKTPQKPNAEDKSNKKDDFLGGLNKYF